MVFGVALLFDEVLKSQVFHHFIQGDWVKRLDDLQAAADRKLRGLLFQAREKNTLNAPYVDLLEGTDLIFPLHDESSLV